MKPVSDVQELFRCQRAIRSFTDEDVPDALVDQVLTAAIHGPSGSNTQPWHFIVIRDQAVKQAVSEVYEEAWADAYRDRPPSASGPRQPLSAAPVLIVACVDTPASGQAGFQTGASIYPSVQNLMLAARALGLGTVLTTLHRRRKARPRNPRHSRQCRERGDHPGRLAGPRIWSQPAAAAGAVRDARPLESLEGGPSVPGLTRRTRRCRRPGGERS